MEIPQTTSQSALASPGASRAFRRDDRFGLVYPGVEAHTLGIYSVQQLLEHCGIVSLIADARICSAIDRPEVSRCADEVEKWLRANSITMLGCVSALRRLFPVKVETNCSPDMPI